MFFFLKKVTLYGDWEILTHGSLTRSSGVHESVTVN
jgi:hypothetical protein